MQAQENAIDFSTLHRGDDGIPKPLEGGALHLAARPRRSAEDMVNLPAIFPAGIGETGQFRVGVASRANGVVSYQNIMILE